MNVLRLKAKVGVAAHLLWMMLKKYVKSPFSWPTLIAMSVVVITNMLIGNFASVLLAFAILLHDFRAVMALIALQNTREIDCEVYGKAVDMIFEEDV